MTGKEQRELNDRLVAAAADGREDVVERCLAEGADVNAVNGRKRTALTRAAYYGYAGIVKILLAAGADKNLFDDEGVTAEGDARVGGYGDLADLIRDYVPPAPPSPDEIIFHRPLGDRTLQESFNFVSLERISLIRESPQGAVEAMFRESFSKIDDEDALRKAFDEHVKRGGTVEESVVFPNKLPKAKMPRMES